jgi:hypothetical protein
MNVPRVKPGGTLSARGLNLMARASEMMRQHRAGLTSINGGLSSGAPPPEPAGIFCKIKDTTTRPVTGAKYQAVMVELDGTEIVDTDFEVREMAVNCYVPDGQPIVAFPYLGEWGFLHSPMNIGFVASRIDEENPTTAYPGESVLSNTRASGSGGPDAGTEQRVLLHANQSAKAAQFDRAEVTFNREAIWRIAQQTSIVAPQWLVSETFKWITEDYDPATVTWATKPATSAACGSTKLHGYLYGMAVNTDGVVQCWALYPYCQQVAKLSAPSSGTVYGIEISGNAIEAYKPTLVDVLTSADWWITSVYPADSFLRTK